MAHTARSFTFQTFEGGSGAVTNGHGGAERPHSLGESWLEALHKQHVSAREKRNVDVAQAKLLRRELVTFFGLYRRDDLGRADDLLREWKGGRELEDINRELKKQYQVLIERERERGAILITHPINPSLCRIGAARSNSEQLWRKNRARTALSCSVVRF